MRFYYNGEIQTTFNGSPCNYTWEKFEFVVDAPDRKTANDELEELITNIYQTYKNSNHSDDDQTTISDEEFVSQCSIPTELVTGTVDRLSLSFFHPDAIVRDANGTYRLSKFIYFTSARSEENPAKITINLGC